MRDRQRGTLNSPELWWRRTRPLLLLLLSLSINKASSEACLGPTSASVPPWGGGGHKGLDACPWPAEIQKQAAASSSSLTELLILFSHREENKGPNNGWNFNWNIAIVPLPTNIHSILGEGKGCRDELSSRCPKLYKGHIIEHCLSLKQLSVSAQY